MSTRPAWLAWTLWVLALAIYGLGHSLSAPTEALAIANTVLNAAFVVVFELVGALIVARQPRNTIGWLMIVIALTFALPDFGANPGAAGAPIAPTFDNLLAAWLNAWSWWLLRGPLLLIMVLFPTGRPATPRWRWVIVSLAACLAIFLLLNKFARDIETPDETQVLPNPIGFISEDLLNTVILPWTALLALAYLGSVLVLQSLFGVLTGQIQSALVTVRSTLVIAALFVPLRGRVQRVIDRRFFRRKYDAAHTLAAFGATLRDETNLDELAARLTDVVDEAMRPTHVVLWLTSSRPGLMGKHEID
jgi:hypothetical protein